jgi:pimeloyl-ACP methyl ester carboxylesterase
MNFVLLHGSFHGGWCWGRVAPLLRIDGHAVHSPTLTGLGERSHLLSPDVGLSTHIEDIVNFIQGEALSDIVLVPHSQAGFVAAGVVELMPKQIRHIVYLDALLPEHGQSFMDVSDPDIIEAGLDACARLGDGWRVPPFPARTFGISDDHDVAWVDARLTAQSLKTFQEPLNIPEGQCHNVPSTYIACTRPVFAPSLSRAREISMERGMPCIDLPQCHDAMITAPQDVARFVLDAVDEGVGEKKW